MKKVRRLFFGCLLLMIASIQSPMMPAAASELDPAADVQVSIHTKLEGEETVEGIENLTFTVYDLTSWRHTNNLSEKAAKEFLLDQQATKEKMAAFIAKEQLRKVNELPISVDAEGKACLTLPRFLQEQDAGYLLIAEGETGQHQLVPIVLFLPQYDVNGKTENWAIEIHGKHTTKISTEKPKELPATKATGNKDVQTNTSKRLPQTNEVLENGAVFGGLLILVGALGLKQQTRRKNK
ncbi:hypothetical protein NRIC_22770 [Enterococcus florum]|uniref:Gram-positive pilin subunit D1 N-terminal domain-containing protein n=1 Tax=Enterococcus florum TaxID=2480627 RepID=A0A4P5P9V9_9ENTE|nr:pilin N-terminal domain-containing protein [Enterococcus florum]GCF94386.1 hypothetical protein NRIC_22770 [Enterococcus florum]